MYVGWCHRTVSNECVFLRTSVIRGDLRLKEGKVAMPSDFVFFHETCVFVMSYGPTWWKVSVQERLRSIWIVCGSRGVALHGEEVGEFGAFCFSDPCAYWIYSDRSRNVESWWESEKGKETAEEGEGLSKNPSSCVWILSFRMRGW